MHFQPMFLRRVLDKCSIWIPYKGLSDLVNVEVCRSHNGEWRLGVLDLPSVQLNKKVKFEKSSPFAQSNNVAHSLGCLILAFTRIIYHFPLLFLSHNRHHQVSLHLCAPSTQTQLISCRIALHSFEIQKTKS